MGVDAAGDRAPAGTLHAPRLSGLGWGKGPFCRRCPGANRKAWRTGREAALGHSQVLGGFALFPANGVGQRIGGAVNPVAGGGGEQRAVYAPSCLG